MSSRPPRTVVHLLRHGEVHNPEGILYGRIPGFRLSERGEKMARRVAEHLHSGGHDVRLVISSPLERAQQTATPVAEAYGLPIRTDARLIEAANHFEGTKFGRNSVLTPANWWYMRNPLAPSWGEPYPSQAQRVLHVVAQAAVDVEGHEAVLVGHQLPIWITRSQLEGRRLAHDPRRRECSLASLTSITVERGRIVGVRYTEPAKDLLPSTRQVPGA